MPIVVSQKDGSHKREFKNVRAIQVLTFEDAEDGNVKTFFMLIHDDGNTSTFEMSEWQFSLMNI